MGVALEDMDAELNGTTYALLGDTIVYTPQGGTALTLKAIVDSSDDQLRLGNSRLQADESAVEVPRSLIAEPKNGDRITGLPGRPSKTYAPKSHLLDDSGRNWLIVLKPVP